jgi:hypothetical protein
MAKEKGAKQETKSDFLRKVLGNDPALDHREVNFLWQKMGHLGEISSALFYQVRSKMGIKTQWQWVFDPEAAQAVSRPGRGSASKPKKPQPTKATGTVYQLKITLKDVRPPIWRRALVPDCSLEELHEIIQVAMGWENYHLFDFEVGGERYTDSRGADELEMEDASQVLLSELVPKEKFKFGYTYDFGDDWRHEIVVEKILPQGAGRDAPVCLDGKRACPPEDVGGPWGYVDYLQALADPEHESHEDMLEWGGEFDPEAFDLDEVNKVLRRMR